METTKPGFFAEVKDIAEHYIQDRILLAKLEASERLADFTSRFYIILPLLFISFIVILVATFLAGFYLSEWLGAYWAGFGLIILLYIAAAFLLVYLHRKKYKKLMADKVVESFFTKNS